ncbi:MAG: hypothetical protein ACI89L_002423 [Phycisphaerales bacterium]|jgi:hypothetical protein
MILSLIVIGVVLGLTYLWLIRGFFNAFLHMVCVLVAGAIAFAAWEPVSYALLGVLPKSGTVGFLQGGAWGIGLIVPFAVSLVVLRLVVDSLIKANLTLSSAADYVGGGVCGFIASTIAVGMLVIGMGGLPLSSNFGGYQPVWFNADRSRGVGSIKLTDSLLFPADKLTANLYSTLSLNAFGSSQPLAKWYPELHAVGFASRMSTEDGKGRSTLQPTDFRLQSMYTVGNEKTGTPAGGLLVDMRDPEVPQPYADVNGESVDAGWLAGYVIRFEPGAKENGARGAGPVSIGNGQIRLVVRHDDGTTSNAFPIAAVSQASAGENVYGRWRYNSDGIHIASVGGASTATMAFEFMLRPGDEPIGLFVKNVRVNLEINEPDKVAYADVAGRDAVVTDGDILTGGKVRTSTLDLSEAATAGPEDGVAVSGSLGTNIRLQTIRAHFQVSDEGNLIISGEGQLDKSDVNPQNVSGLPGNLVVKSFGAARDQQIIKVDVGQSSPSSLLGAVARRQQGDVPIRLIDDNGTEYDAVGYLYRDDQIWYGRYTPASPLNGLNDIDTPSLTNSRDDQSLELIFVVSQSIQIEHFAIGDKVIVTYSPAIEISGR